MKSFAYPVSVEPCSADGLPSVLIPVDPPRHMLDTTGWASWHTWSPDFRQLLSKFAERVDPSWPTPHIEELHPGDRYARTFSLATSVKRDYRWRCLLEELSFYAASLVTMPKPSRVLLLTGLLDGVTPRSRIRFIVAALRQAIVELFGDENAAYYAPLGSTGSNVGAFAAHSDLYVPELLMNIFEDVPGDGSGASVFISADRFCQALRETPSVPPRIEMKIKALLQDELQDDGFDDFYKTAYGRGAAWSEQLRATVASLQAQVSMRAGEGYLIHDRSWLHGREAPSCGVGANRLHRLVFRHAESVGPTHGTIQLAGRA